MLLATACGLTVPNLSRWGLDYCGGGMDMLASVPGYDGARRRQDPRCVGDGRVRGTGPIVIEGTDRRP